MKIEHRAIVQRAKKDGLLPSELAVELLAHDLLQTCVDQLNRFETPFKKLGEKQQDAAIGDMQAEIKKAVLHAASVINSAGAETVSFTLKSMKIDKNLTVVGTVSGEDPNRHVLTDKAHDKSEILLVLYPRDYFDGLDAIQGERDQKDLPLNEPDARPKAPRKKAEKVAEAPKPIDLPDGLIAQAEEFAHKFQNATHAGLQNHLKINFDKAEALLQELEKRGIVSAEDSHGNRMYLRKKAQEATQEPAGEANDDETYFAARELVIREQRVSAGFLQSELAIGSEQAAAVIRKLELDGVIGEENDLGGRAVLISGEGEEVATV